VTSAIEVIEVWVLERCECGYSSVRVKSDQACEQVNLKLVECGCVLTHMHAAELGES